MNEIQPLNILEPVARGFPSRRAVISTASVVLSLLVLVIVYEIFFARPVYQGEKKVRVDSGLGSRQIGEILKSGGVIRSKWAFITYVSVKNVAASLKPGTYTFGEDATIPSITKDLVRGVSERTIVIPEGWTAREIGAYFMSLGIGAGDSFDNLVSAEKSSAFSKHFPTLREKPESTGLEGYLFPDTYRVFIDTPRDLIISKMLSNFEKKVTRNLRDEIDRQKRTLFEVLTMASMIEREVVSDEDRALVSGVLWKRIELGMPLQVDATISYVKTGREDAKSLSPRITIEDTKIDSKYNTYKYRGLPPGPICNPGLSAIKAAVYPKESSYLYYLSTPEGKTIFSKTLEEHNIAKSKYLNPRGI